MRKEEIRHDPVRENIIKSVEYIKDNQNIILKVFIGLVILVSGISYYNHMGSVKVENASNIAGLAQNIFINGDIDKAMVKFERVMGDYPNTPGALQSLVYLLNEAISSNDIDKVIKLLSDNDGIINDPNIRIALIGHNITAGTDIKNLGAVRGNLGVRYALHLKNIHGFQNITIASKNSR